MALLTAILIAAALCNLQAQQAPEPPGRPTISVAGEAVVNVPPDKIILRFGVETFDQQLAKGTTVMASSCGASARCSATAVTAGS